MHGTYLWSSHTKLTNNNWFPFRLVVSSINDSTTSTPAILPATRKQQGCRVYFVTNIFLFDTDVIEGTHTSTGSWLKVRFSGQFPPLVTGRYQNLIRHQFTLYPPSSPKGKSEIRTCHFSSGSRNSSERWPDDSRNLMPCAEVIFFLLVLTGTGGPGL